MSLEDVRLQVRQGHERTRSKVTPEPSDDKLLPGGADLMVFEGQLKVSQMFHERLLVRFELPGPNADPFLFDLTPSEA